jgi:hypothetical protein
MLPMARERILRAAGNSIANSAEENTNYEP